MLSALLDNPVMVFTPSFKGIKQIDLGRYMFNVAMAMKPALYVNEAVCPAASLNVLPARYQPKPISLKKVVGIPAGIAPNLSINTCSDDDAK